MPHHKNRGQRHGSGEGAHQGPGGDLGAPLGAQAQGAAGAQEAGSGGIHHCCLPKGCERYFAEMIRDDEPGDAVKVFCNNENCSEGKWMHADCFQEWEQHVLSYLKSCGRARSWSEKQRLQNLWTKKGYDLAYKACDCKCGCGHLRKDLNYFQRPAAAAGAANGAAAAAMDKKQKKLKAKPKNEKTMVGSNANGGGANGKTAGGATAMPQTALQMSHQGPHGAVGHNSAQRLQLRVRTSSFSSTGSSPPSSAGTPPLTPGGGKPKFDFFTNPEQAAAGNIFRRRVDLSVFNMLPHRQQNAYQIKMEDEGPHGNDETRCFLLTNLSAHHVTQMNCVVCNHDLPIFDKYPLLDGTFFLSPQRYNSDLQVLYEHRMLHLNAVCMQCLVNSRGCIRCRACKAYWDGSTLIIGTMYSYDIFAAQPCCASRLSCKNCRRTILDPGCFKFFSEYSKLIQCPHCRVQDFHFVKQIKDAFLTRFPSAPIRM